MRDADTLRQICADFRFGGRRLDSTDVSGTPKRATTRRIVHREAAERYENYRETPGDHPGRAALLALALSAAMEHRGRPPSHASTWSAERSDLLDRFGAAYRAIEKPVHDADGATVPMILDHRRALVQLRLNLALLSRWLATERSDGGAQHGNSIGAVTMPLAIRSVLSLRGRTGDDATGCLRWRRDWPHLGRFSGEPGRVRRAEMVLSDAAGAPLLNVRPE